MALPTLAKTWQFDVNQTITGVDASILTRGAILALKNSLKGFALSPWTVQDSGNTTASGGDTWSTIADLVPGSGGSGSWIQLRQTGIAAAFEIVIGMDNTTALDTRAYILASYTGFSGGTASTRPTATDEFALGAIHQAFPNQCFNWFSTIAVQHRLHVWQATDGSATYWQYYQADVAEHGGAIMLPLLPTGGWTNPHIAAVRYDAGLGNLISSSEVYAHVSNLRQNGACTTEARIFGGPLLYTDTGGQLSTLDNSYILSPVGFQILAGGGNSEHGRFGSFVDAWVTSQTLGDVTTFPNNATRQFVMLKGSSCNMVLPWNGSIIETA